MALPDGLTEDDLKNGIVRITEPSEGIGMDAGDEVIAEITGYDTRSVDIGGDTAWYIDFDVRVGGNTFENFDGFSLNEGKVNENTGLGAFLTRLNYDLDDVRGDEFELTELVGTEFAFTAAEDDDGFLQFARDDDGLPVVSPVDEDADPSSGAGTGSSPSDGDSDGGDSDSDGAGEDRQEVIGIIEDNGLEGEPEGTVKSMIAQEDGSLVATFNTLVEQGAIDTVGDDENVVLQ